MAPLEIVERSAAGRSDPFPPVHSKRTPFRLIVSQVHAEETGTVERALRRISAIEWFGFCYDPAVETMSIGGMLPCGPERALDVYLPQLTYCAWDIVWEKTGQARRDKFPEVVLLLNPNGPGEQSQSLKARHFGQYKRRRREFEACGGNVLERWGIQKPPPTEEGR